MESVEDPRASSLDEPIPSKLRALDRAVTEGRNPATMQLHRLPIIEVLRLINAEDAKVAPAVAEELEVVAQAVDVITERMRAGGHLLYFGAGTSGRLAFIDAAECPPTFGSSPEDVVAHMAGGQAAFNQASEDAEDDEEAGRKDVVTAGVSAADVVVGVSASGRTPYVIGAVKAAREIGAFTVGIACQHPSDLAHWVNIMIHPIVGPEVIAGSTRMKAGTAQKMVLNMLSTTVMIRLGRVYSNLMVNLRPNNLKLKRRACRIVSELAEVTEEQATRALEETGYDVKAAIVVLRLGVTAREARERLLSKSGQLTEVLGG